MRFLLRSGMSTLTATLLTVYSFPIARIGDSERFSTWCPCAIAYFYTEKLHETVCAPKRKAKARKIDAKWMCVVKRRAHQMHKFNDGRHEILYLTGYTHPGMFLLFVLNSILMRLLVLCFFFSFVSSLILQFSNGFGKHFFRFVCRWTEGIRDSHENNNSEILSLSHRHREAQPIWYTHTETHCGQFLFESICNERENH